METGNTYPHTDQNYSAPLVVAVGNKSLIKFVKKYMLIHVILHNIHVVSKHKWNILEYTYPLFLQNLLYTKQNKTCNSLAVLLKFQGKRLIGMVKSHCPWHTPLT